LFFVNHFLRASPAVPFVERMAAPLARFLGFHPTLSLEGLIAEANLEVTEQLPVNAFGYWTLLRARNNKHSWQRRAV
jgi:phosphatidylethanolamine/phosphatidyl-N-methylethanolamine N-methyltransferase